jgi:tetratricopeptide (TPR) repeat protein
MHLQRGQLLLQQGRHQEAEKELRQALNDNPANFVAHALMCECYLETKRYAEAINFSLEALRYAPDSTFALYMHAKALFYNKKTKEARGIIQQGLSIDPSDADFFGLLANIEFYDEDWDAALKAAEDGLQLSPENVHLVNIRAQALIKLNRQSEAEQTLDYALNKAPENAFSHANKGWVAIEQDRYDDAIGHFKEALRLNPDSNFAQSGLKEAIKGKNILYRMILKYFLWMEKLNERGRWFFIIGAYIVYRILIKLAETNPDIAPFLYPLIALYIIFAFSSWIAVPVSNLFLRLHPLGKHALTDDEKLGSNIMGLSMLAAIGSGLTYWIGGADIALYLTLFFTLLLIPIGGLFGVPRESKARTYLTYYTLTLAACGALFLALQSLLFGGIFLLGIFAYGWVANYFISRERKEFY